MKKIMKYIRKMPHSYKKHRIKGYTKAGKRKAAAKR